MAIKANVSLESVYGDGAPTVTDAYVSLKHAEIRRNQDDEWELVAHVHVWPTSVARSADKEALFRKTYVFPLSTPLPTGDLIDYIETQVLSAAEFTGGTKVPDVKKPKK